MLHALLQPPWMRCGRLGRDEVLVQDSTADQERLSEECTIQRCMHSEEHQARTTTEPCSGPSPTWTSIGAEADCPTNPGP